MPSPVQSPKPFNYTVRAGDTYQSIARQNLAPNASDALVNVVTEALRRDDTTFTPGQLTENEQLVIDPSRLASLTADVEQRRLAGQSFREIYEGIFPDAPGVGLPGAGGLALSGGGLYVARANDSVASITTAVVDALMEHAFLDPNKRGQVTALVTQTMTDLSSFGPDGRVWIGEKVRIPSFNMWDLSTRFGNPQGG